MNGTTVRRSPGRKGTPRTEPKSKLPQTVAEVLGKHVRLEVESIDRMYLNAIVPRLQIVEGVLRFIRQQRKAKGRVQQRRGTDDSPLRACHRAVCRATGDSDGKFPERATQRRAGG